MITLHDVYMYLIGRVQKRPTLTASTRDFEGLERRNAIALNSVYSNADIHAWRFTRSRKKASLGTRMRWRVTARIGSVTTRRGL
jgi:hypothetical protein